MQLAALPVDDALRAETGMPVGTTAVWVAESGAGYGKRWADYTIEVLGEVVGPATPDDPDFQRWPWPWVVVVPVRGAPDDDQVPDDAARRFLDSLYDAGLFVIKAWVVRVRRSGVPGYVEQRWHPDLDGVTTSLLGIEARDHDRASRALGGLSLLALPLGLSPQGRRPDPELDRKARELAAVMAAEPDLTAIQALARIGETFAATNGDRARLRRSRLLNRLEGASESR